MQLVSVGDSAHNLTTCTTVNKKTAPTCSTRTSLAWRQNSVAQFEVKVELYQGSLFTEVNGELSLLD